MQINVLSGATYALSNATNYATNGYPTKAPTLTQPSGDGVIPCGFLGSESPEFLTLLPIGVGASNNTFSMRVLGWRPTQIPALALRPLWIPVPLVDYAMTLGTASGATGGELGTTTLFADTITSTVGPTFITSGAAPIAPGWYQISPVNDLVGMIHQATLGFPFLELIFTTGGVATSCNCLWARG